MGKITKVALVCVIGLSILVVVWLTHRRRINPKSVAVTVPLNDLLKQIYRDPVYPVSDVIWRARDKIAIRLNCAYAPLHYFDSTYHLRERSDIDGVSIVNNGDVELASFSKSGDRLQKLFDSLRCSGNKCLPLADTLSRLYEGDDIDYRKLVVSYVTNEFVYVQQYIIVTNLNGIKNRRDIEAHVYLDGRIGAFLDWPDSAENSN